MACGNRGWDPPVNPGNEDPPENNELELDELELGIKPDVPIGPNSPVAGGLNGAC